LRPGRFSKFAKRRVPWFEQHWFPIHSTNHALERRFSASFGKCFTPSSRGKSWSDVYVS
jgi:hypothetical protein